MHGALLKNDKGGVVISDETPLYLAVSSPVVAVSTSTITNTRVAYADGRGVRRDMHMAWAAAAFNTKLTIRVPGTTLPMIAVKGSKLNSFTGEAALSAVTYSRVPHIRGGFTYTQYYASACFVDSIVRDASADAGGLTGWTVNIVGSSTFSAADIKVFVLYDDNFRDATIETGMNIYKPDGSVVFSTSLKSPYVIETMKLSKFSATNFTSPLSSNSFSNSRFSVLPSSIAVNINRYYVISSGGYGVMSSTSTSFWHGWQDGWNGWSETTYGATYSMYRTGVCVVNGMLSWIAMPITLQNHYTKDRSDNGVGIGAVVAIVAAAYTGGASLALLTTVAAAGTGSLVTLSRNYDVSQINTTYDGHLNTIIELAN